MADVDILEVNDTTLEEWLGLVRSPPSGKIFVRNMFPTDAHRQEWLATSHHRSESEVKLLLRNFLVSTGSNPIDKIHARLLVARLQGSRLGDVTLREHDRRLILNLQSRDNYPAWEGLGWVIDLLPQRPRAALNVLDAFFDAYYSDLTDNYLTGLFDAQAIIRARYIESPHTADGATRVLLGLDWRELELLCAAAYRHMGYDAIVTAASGDDGADVFAASHALGQKGLLLIQAKKWSDSNPVGKAQVRELLGAVDLHRATRGVLVTTGRFESGAVEMADKDSRIELLNREQVLRVLNEHCGSDWFTRADRLLASVKLADRLWQHGASQPASSPEEE